MELCFTLAGDCDTHMHQPPMIRKDYETCYTRNKPAQYRKFFREHLLCTCRKSELLVQACQGNLICAIQAASSLSCPNRQPTRQCSQHTTTTQPTYDSKAASTHQQRSQHASATQPAHANNPANTRQQRNQHTTTTQPTHVNNDCNCLKPGLAMVKPF